MGTDFEGYKEWLLDYAPAELEFAAQETGIPADKIPQAVEMLSCGDGEHPKASFGFENGNYWSNDYTNTVSFAALGSLCGAGNHPGRVINCMGGHQRGWMGAGFYPRGKNPYRSPSGTLYM